MEAAHFHSQIFNFPPQSQFMIPFSIAIRHSLSLLHRFPTASATTFKLFSTSSTATTTPTQEHSIVTLEQPILVRKTLRRKGNKVRSQAQIRENWLDSLSCPFPNANKDAVSEWVIGIDPDVSGALALLKPDQTAQVGTPLPSSC